MLYRMYFYICSENLIHILKDTEKLILQNDGNNVLNEGIVINYLKAIIKLNITVRNKC